jgi:glycosyltransferase involved in cell wall biosynthesis
MKTVLLDVTDTIPKFGSAYVMGMGRANLHLINALSTIEDLPFELKLYVSGWKGRAEFDFYNWKFHHTKFLFPDAIKLNGSSLAPLYRKYIKKYDLFHVHNQHDVYRTEHFVATIHDCEEYKRIKNDEIKAKYRFNVHHSKAISTCSNFSKADIVETFGVAPEKVSVIYWGVDRDYYRIQKSYMVDSVKKKYKIHSPFFFMCSCKAERKNARNVLKAFRNFSTNFTEHILVLAWSNPPKDILEDYADEIEKGKIVFLNFVTDDEMVSLYNGASITLYPSRYEGFGFPILESLACGTPVMTCKNTSLPEVGGDAVLYVGEDSINEMVDVMKMIDKGDYDLDVFHLKREKQLQMFSWKNVARDYCNFYLENL